MKKIFVFLILGPLVLAADCDVENFINRELKILKDQSLEYAELPPVDLMRDQYFMILIGKQIAYQNVKNYIDENL